MLKSTTHESLEGPLEHLHVLLGTGARASLRCDEFSAYARRIRARLEAAVASCLTDTYPEPGRALRAVPWSAHCGARREADAHLSLVARLTRSQARRLATAGIGTLDALAAATNRPTTIAEPTFERLRQQARLQAEITRAIAAAETSGVRSVGF